MIGDAPAGTRGGSISSPAVPTFIELRLTTGERRHVQTGDSAAQTEIHRWAQRAKASWIETVERIWVNPDHIVTARLVELPSVPTDTQD